MRKIASWATVVPGCRPGIECRRDCPISWSTTRVDWRCCGRRRTAVMPCLMPCVARKPMVPVGRVSSAVSSAVGVTHKNCVSSGTGLPGLMPGACPWAVSCPATGAGKPTFLVAASQDPGTAGATRARHCSVCRSSRAGSLRTASTGKRSSTWRGTHTAKPPSIPAVVKPVVTASHNCAQYGRMRTSSPVSRPTITPG